MGEPGFDIALLEVLLSQTKDDQKESLNQPAEPQRPVALTIHQQDWLLDLRREGEVGTEVFAKKQLDLRDRLARLKLQLDASDRSHDEMTDLAAKVFELSQTLPELWLTADYAEKRCILEIVF